ncbi:MAG TPA: DUF167 domain-containing protein [Longimicrobiales bacterium]
MTLQIEQRGSAVRIPVRAQPRASRSEIAGEHDGALRVRLAAPPVEGAANDELVRLLARVLGVPRSAVRVVAGQRGRTKVVEVDGVDAAAALRAFGL